MRYAILICMLLNAQSLWSQPTHGDGRREVTVVDVNFDRIRDRLVFDGYTFSGGNSTRSYRVYLYSREKKDFVFNEALSKLSHEEALMLDDKDMRRNMLVTYARPGGGLFQNRWYRIVDGRPKLVKELIYDATYADGRLTRETIRTLVGRRWVVKKKIFKGSLNR